MTPESKSHVVHENLDTTFVNLWALLRTLSQRGFVGRVRVELKDYTADVFMTGSNTPLVHEIDRAAGTDTLEEGALHRLVLRARGAPGTISVFEGADQAVAGPNTASDTGLSPVDHAPDVRATTDTEVSIASSDRPGLTPDFETLRSGIAGQPAHEAQAQSRSESALPALPSTAVPESLTDDDPPMDEIEWSAVVKASGELVSGVERALTSVEADFASLFGAARLELADDYSFLDPMSDAFTYSNSVVTLSSELPAHSYVSGLSEALRRVVDRVATGDRARRVRERVALELFSVARKRHEILVRSGFQAQLDRIAGTKVI